MASDTLSQPGMGLSLYVFPAIPLLEKTLIQMREDPVEEVIIIFPILPRKSWYHLLFQMACKIPLLLLRTRELLSQCLPDKGTLFNTELTTLKLMVCKLSGMPSRTRTFKQILSDSLPLETQLEQSTKAGGKASLAGVVKGVRIPFEHL